MAIGTTAAIVGSAALSAGASLIGSSKASKAQQRAADQAAATERENIALQREIFNQQRADLAPWRNAGSGALAQLVKELPSLTAAPDASQFRADPGYQFAYDEGQRAIDRSAAARGSLNSGGTLKALARYGQGMADQQYGNWWDRQRAVQGDRYNRLANIAGVGQTATTQTNQAAQNMGAQIGGSLSGIANAAMQAGNARASGYASTASAINQGVGNLAGMYLYNQGYGGGGGFNAGAAYSSLPYNMNSLQGYMQTNGIGGGLK